MKTNTNEQKEPTVESIVTHLNTLSNTSQKMRYLIRTLGSVKATHKFLNEHYPREDGKEWRYQHVRNVHITPLVQK